MSTSAAAPITILAIDHETRILEQIAHIVEGAGFRCHCAHDAPSAHEAMHDATPDLIISDVNLAGRSGVTVCEHLKHEAGWDEVPVMFLSSGQGPDIIRRAHRAGGSYFLRKPFDAPVLLQLIEQARHVSEATGA